MNCLFVMANSPKAFPLIGPILPVDANSSYERGPSGNSRTKVKSIVLLQRKGLKIEVGVANTTLGETKVPSICKFFSGTPFIGNDSDLATFSTTVLTSVTTTIGRKKWVNSRISRTVRIFEPQFAQPQLDRSLYKVFVNKAASKVSIVFAGADGGLSYLGALQVSKAKVVPLYFVWHNGQSIESVVKKLGLRSQY